MILKVYYKFLNGNGESCSFTYKISRFVCFDDHIEYEYYDRRIDGVRKDSVQLSKILYFTVSPDV